MEVSEQDKAIILRLAKEGKTISKIVKNDMNGKYEYIDVYRIISSDGEQGALGIKRMISNRLTNIAGAKKPDRTILINEIGELAESLYKKSQANQKKLDELRHILDK